MCFISVLSSVREDPHSWMLISVLARLIFLNFEIIVVYLLNTTMKMGLIPVTSA